MKKKILVLACLCLLSCTKAHAFFITKLITLVFKPVTIPLRLTRRLVFGGVTNLAGKGAKAGKSVLRNVSVQTGPVKVRPFDFQN